MRICRVIVRVLARDTCILLMDLLCAEDDVCVGVCTEAIVSAEPVSVALSDSPLKHPLSSSDPATCAAKSTSTPAPAVRETGGSARPQAGAAKEKADSPLDLRSVLVVLSRFLAPTPAVAVRIASIQWLQKILSKAPNRVYSMLVLIRTSC